MTGHNDTGLGLVVGVRFLHFKGGGPPSGGIKIRAHGAIESKAVMEGSSFFGQR